MTSVIRILLWPLSMVYAIAIIIWDRYWEKAPKVKLPGKIISVGNITAGGAGKTPLVILVAKLAIEAGWKTAVVARGYRRKNKGLVEVNAKSTWREVGDEPLEVHDRVDNVRVYVDRSKTIAARKAANDGAEVIIVDDGFQHRRLYRDIDLVCLNWLEPFGSGGLLPSGLLREPAGHLKRADILVFTSYDPNRLPGAEIEANSDTFYARSETREFMNIRTKAREKAAFLQSRRPLAFCGLARPDKFIGTLRKLAVDLVAMRAFPDHFRYHQKDIDNLIKMAAGAQADCLITTCKDAVKIGGFDFGDFDVYSAMLDIVIVNRDGENRLAEFKMRLGL